MQCAILLVGDGQGGACAMANTCFGENVGGGATSFLLSRAASAIQGSFEVYAHLAHTLLAMQVWVKESQKVKIVVEFPWYKILWHLRPDQEAARTPTSPASKNEGSC